MITVGITGGVGAGKSKVIEYIKESCNCVVILADDFAKELEKKGNPCYEPLVQLLGTDILGSDGEIVPSLMSAKIFKDSDLLGEVNKIVHPAVKTGVIKLIDDLKEAGNVDFFFLEAALLIEDGYKQILDEIWYVYADSEVRRARLKESRGYSDEKVDRILANQLSDAIFTANADYTIDNSGNFETTIIQIDKRLAGYSVDCEGRKNDF